MGMWQPLDVEHLCQKINGVLGTTIANIHHIQWSDWLFNTHAVNIHPDSTATTNTSKWRYVIILLVTGIVEARTSERILWCSENYCDVIWCHTNRYFIWFPFPSVFPTLNKFCSLPRLNVIKQISPSFQSVSTTLPLWNRQCYFHSFSSVFLQLWNLFPTLFLFVFGLFVHEVHRSSHGGGFFPFHVGLGLGTLFVPHIK